MKRFQPSIEFLIPFRLVNDVHSRRHEQHRYHKPSVAASCKTPTNHQSGDEWIGQLDLDEFTREIRSLGKRLADQEGPADVEHLHKIIMWSNACPAIGLLTMGFSVNLVSIVALSTWTCSRWTMIAHHTCHGGYDRTIGGRFSRFRFAVGSLWRRANDWLDWMMPEAWNVEHNNRHHYCLSEIDDPDLVEANLAFLRDLKLPMFAKHMMVAFFMGTWKWFYYSPNTYKELKLAKWRKDNRPIPEGVRPEEALTLKSLVEGKNPFFTTTEFLSTVLAPYLLIHFFLLPLPYLLLSPYLGMDGTTLYKNAILNLVLAEVLTNIHSFIIIVTNHAGNDLYRFQHGCRPFSGSFYLRQMTASVNYSMGNDVVDFWHGWLNYQIEHHLWPNLSMLSYQKAAPQVQAICEKHGVPYVKENVFIRLKKTVDIMTGAASMKRFPEDFERAFLEQDARKMAASY